MTQDTRTKPKLSVIMANRNGVEFLQGAVESVLSQSFSDFELIVSDDCSTDNSLTVLSNISDTRLRVITATESLGPGGARNRAIDVARGTWIAIVDADDLMHRDRFQTLLETTTNTDAIIVADNQLFFEGADQATGATLFPVASRTIQIDIAALLDPDFLGQPNQLGYLKPIIRRDALADLRYRSDLPIGEDFDLLLRLTMAGHALALISEALYFYRRRSGSTSHRLKPKDAAAMITALTDIRALAPNHKGAIDTRISALRHRMTLETVVQDAKAWRLGRAALGVACDPIVAMDLGKIAKRKVFRKRPATPFSGVLPSNLAAASFRKQTMVHVRVPTFQRPEQLRRALEGLQNQTEPNWICDVYDDDPSCSSERVVTDLRDARINYHANRQNLLASKNIDQCFTKANPHHAQFFCVLEDDNQLLPTHLEDNIRVIEREGVEIVMRNQLVEYASGTEDAHLSDTGLLESKFDEGIYSPERFHLALLADMGASNGGLFWSNRAVSDLEIKVTTSATLQEYLRTFAIVEPVYVAMTPTAVWAENGTNTTRDLGSAAGWFRRELALKRSVQVLQRLVWNKADDAAQSDFVQGNGFRYPASMRAAGLVKSHTRLFVSQALSPSETLRLALRGTLIRIAGRPEPGLSEFLKRFGADAERS